MPKTSSAFNPHGVSILFTEEDHSYKSVIGGKEIPYISVTTLASTFFPKFDVEKIAPLSAKKRGMTVEAIKEEWKLAGEEACRLGTKIHETCEDNLLGRPERNVPSNEKEFRLMGVARKAAVQIKETFDIIGVEKLVFNENWRIAGTIDLLARAKKSGKLYILDWKTNARILTENDFGKKGLGPLMHLDDCNFNHYALQLSLYQKLLLETGYVSKNEQFERALLHLTEFEARSVKIPYFGMEVDKIIEILKRKGIIKNA
jgi:hypothetical protein